MKPQKGDANLSFQTKLCDDGKSWTAAHETNPETVHTQ